MEGVNIEDDPMLLTDSSVSGEDICTSSTGSSSGANKLKRGGNECKINEGGIYAFMRFPRSFATESVSPVVHSRQDSISACDIEFPTLLGSMDKDFLDSLISLTGDNAGKRLKSDITVSVNQMKAAVYMNVLLRVAYSAAEARFLDCSSFKLLDKILMEFASIWMNMRDKVKTKEEQESQQYSFKPRAVKISKVFEIDITSFGSILSSEIFSEWQELLSKEKFTQKKKVKSGDEALEDEWNFLQESVLKDIVHIHNSVFGSEDLVRSPGNFEISEADRLSLFEDSYTLGVKMIKSSEGTLPSSLDAKLSPEHLLHLSLDHKNIVVSHKPTRAYNFYKDSNPPVMAKMMELLVPLKERILIRMTEYDDHPALQKILAVITMILGIPLSTPLSKALMALRFLLNRVQIVSEIVSKFSLSDQLEPILDLVLSWSKLEFESWPALLDEVQSQYEMNAEKLWLPLYSILQHTQPADLKCLKRYIRRSNVGEFRKRLQLLFAMHGHIKTGISQGSYLSPSHLANEKMLYYVFGLYVHFLPGILNYINVERESIELEIEEFLGSCQWEQSDAYFMDKLKTNREKFKRIIQKYNDKLKQPIMIILEQEANIREMASQTVQDSSPPNLKILRDALKEPRFDNNVRSAWIDTWKTETEAALRKLQVARTTEFGFPDSSEVTRIMESCNVYKEEMKKIWRTIKKMFENVLDCRLNWKEGRASSCMWYNLSVILKRLHSSGLSKPTSALLEIDNPSYNMQHLLLTDGTPSVNDNEKLHRLETEWRSANKDFFRNIFSFRQLKDILKNPHKSFSKKQVEQTLVYLYSLIVIQHEQRATAYKIAARLDSLKKSILPLENLFTSSDSISFPENQHAIFNCMWQQKQLLDGSCALLLDVSLLLRTVENSSLDTCQKGVTKLLPFVEEFVPQFQKSKDSLDNYLLGKDRIITSVEVKLQPNGVTKQMEQFVNQNFSLIRDFEKRVSAFRKQDVGGGSVAEILFGHLESVFVKTNNIAAEYEAAVQAGNNPEHMDEGSDQFVSGFVQVLEQTYKNILDSLSKFCSSNSQSVTENSLVDICTWKAIFELNMSSLESDEIRDGLAETIRFSGYILNQNSSVNRGHAAYIKHLYQLLEQTLAYGHGLLLDFLEMHRAVSQLTDELIKLFGTLYSKGFPLSFEQLDKQNPGKYTYEKP